MTIPSNYYVNVAKDGKWFCTVELGNVLPENAKAKFAEVKARFDGYDCKLYKFCGGSKEIA